MKVQCPKCSATYRISDDRVPAGGGTVKVRCKNCGNVMDIQTAGSRQAPVSERWFVAIGNEKRGPMDREQVIAMIRSGEIGMETYVWRKGFMEWQRLGDVAELAEGGSGTGATGASSRTPTTSPQRLQSASETEPTVMEPLPTAAIQGRDVSAHMAEESGPWSGTRPEASDSRPGADVAAVPSSTTDTSKPSASEEESETRMIWQRRETSVLFSLDDYKTRKKTRSVKAVTAPAPVVQVEPLSTDREEAPATGGTERVKVISLEEAEVKRVAEALRQRQRRRVLIRNVALAALGGGVVVAVGAYFVMARFEGGEAVREQGQAMQPSVPAPAPAPPREPVVSPEPVAPPPSAPVAEEPTKKPPAEAPTAPKSEQHATAKVTPKGKPTRSEAAATPAPREPEERQKPPSRPATEDVNALLANLRSGQGGGAATAERTEKPAVDSGEALPEQLTTPQIQSVLRKQQKSVEECIRASGVAPGTTVTVNTRIEIEGSGRVTSASVSNAGAAEGCIRSVLTGLKFPRFKGANMAVPYPFRVSL